MNVKEFAKALGDYPDLQPWQEEVLTKFQGKGAIQITGRQLGKSWANKAMQRLMDDLVARPIEDIRCSEGTIFGKRYLTAEPVGGNWIEMEKIDNSAYSSLSNRNDFKEFYYKFPDSQLTGTNGEVQYVNSQGVTLTGFKYYQIKIGLTADNSAVVPRVGDLRAIALQL